MPEVEQESPRIQLRTALIERCWKDPEFQKKVVADPKGMFEQASGRKLPENVKIIVHEEDANTLHLAIPPSPEQLAELSDEDLERVAGGTEFVASLIALIGTALIATASAAATATITAGATGQKSPW
jgi:hypothetical protein